MATIVTPENPGWPEVYELAVEDPVAGGPDGIDNRPHKELAERTDYLKAETDKARTDIDAQELRLAGVEGSSAIAVSQAQELAWAESDEGYSFEMFGDVVHTMRSFSSVAVTKTVDGDDSVDVESTANIRVGSSYVIFGEDESETVVVGEILTPTRFKAIANLTVTRSSGTLDMTNWDIQSGHAIAPEDGIFYTKPLSTLRFWSDGIFVFRRDTGDGVAEISARKIGESEWKPAEFLESRQETTRTRDERYRIPVGGEVEIKIETSGGSIRFEHLILLTSPQAGRADPVAQPANLTPAAGAVNVMDPATFTGTAPRSLYGDAIASANIFIYSDPEGKVLAHTGTVENPTGNLSYTAPGGTLVENGSGSWQFRYTDIFGNESALSEPTGFSASAVFQFVKVPAIIAPVAESEIMQNNVTIVTAAMQVEPDGVGEHVASQYKITSDLAGLVGVYDSGEVTDLTSHVLGSNLERGKDFYAWARHKDSTRGWSDYCAPVKFHIAEIGNGVRVDGGIALGPYDFADGVTGYLVVAPASQRVQLKHGLYGTDTTLFNMTSAGTPDTGTGAANTATLSSGTYSSINDGQGSVGAPAADYCTDLAFEGCRDFFVMNKEEHNLVYQNKALVDAADDTSGTNIAAMGSNYSWTSSEYNSNGAWVQRFSDGYQDGINESNTYWVLPARRIEI